MKYYKSKITTIVKTSTTTNTKKKKKRPDKQNFKYKLKSRISYTNNIIKLV